MREEKTGFFPAPQRMDVSVLYVEHEGSSRQAVAHVLARKVSRIHLATDGLDGVEVFKRHRPALIITELMIPNLDGCAMCREIRDIDPEVPIIILSSNYESEQLLNSIDLGVLKYLVKPVEYSVLINAIEAAVDGIEKKRAQGKALREAQSALRFVEHDTRLLQEYVERSMGGHLAEFGKIRLHNVPMGAISGDFFCAARRGEDLYLMMADASGHGFSAMIPAMGVPRLFREYAEQGLPLRVIAAEINGSLRRQGLTGHFVAATLVRLISAGRRLEVLNCGNPPALLMDSGLLHEFHSSTFALGMADSEQLHIDVERREVAGKVALYLFTDGLVDTLQQKNSDGVAFMQLFQQVPPADRFDHVVQQANAAMSLGQPDDVTMAEIQIDLPPSSYEPVQCPIVWGVTQQQGGEGWRGYDGGMNRREEGVLAGSTLPEHPVIWR